MIFKDAPNRKEVNKIHKLGDAGKSARVISKELQIKEKSVKNHLKGRSKHSLKNTSAVNAGKAETDAKPKKKTIPPRVET